MNNYIPAAKKFHSWTHDEKINLVKNMKNFVDEFKDVFGLDCFLSSGTLLGAIRNKNFIDHDYDIDMHFVSKFHHHQKDERLNEIANIKQYYLSNNRIRNAGKSTVGCQFHIWFNSDHQNNIYPTPSIKSSMIDLFGSWYNNEHSHYTSGFGNRIFEIKTKNTILPLQPIKFFNTDFLMPNEVEDYLNFQYGRSWRGPGKRCNWPPGEIEQEMALGTLWLLFIGDRENPKKIVGYGRKHLGYIVINENGTCRWASTRFVRWAKDNNNNILYLYNRKNKESAKLYRIDDRTYETKQDDTNFVRIVKLNYNDNNPILHPFIPESASSMFGTDANFLNSLIKTNIDEV